ncbi:MAG: DNA recombination protein RmuC [Xanthomonadales bacterium PRO7]|nr:DNA recombination protein RmuC [Xanthomonadales bacterium PRO7]
MPIQTNDLLLWCVIALAGIILGIAAMWLPLRRARRDNEATKQELDAQRESVLALSRDKAGQAGRLERVPLLERELDQARSEAQRLTEARQRAEQLLTEKSTRLQEQTLAAAERERALTEKFDLLSRQLLDQQSRKLAEQNQANLGVLLNPLREQIGEFRKRVDEVYDKENKDRSALQSEIATLKNLNQRISEDAVNLTRALKGDAQAQGAWGEMILERVLEASGLQKGRGYETQVTLADEAGGRPRPDVIVHLPEGRNIIVDAKVSLTAYERYCRAADGAERNLQLSAHLTSLRKHVRELADKRYADLPGVNSLEFVLMFVPVEAAYIEAVHNDDALHAFALERQVVIVTTSTLLATLRTVESLWRNADRNRNAQEIADRAGKLYDKFAGFVDDLDEVRAKIAAAGKALDAAGGKLNAGPGNLLRQVEMLRELGAKASKALPAEARERAADPLPRVGDG